MPELQCLAPGLKDGMVELLKKNGASRRDIDEIMKVPECDNSVIEFGRARRGGGKKRPPSQYNIFIGNCMRGGKSTLQACAVKWKEQKGRK